MKHDRCPKCGGPLATEKDTFSGRVMREYYCAKCRWLDFDDEGPAMWQILADARREDAACAPPAPVSFWTALRRKLFP